MKTFETDIVTQIILAKEVNKKTKMFANTPTPFQRPSWSLEFAKVISKYKCATSYMAIIMLGQSVTIYRYLQSKWAYPRPWKLLWAKAKYKYANWSSMRLHIQWQYLMFAISVTIERYSQLICAWPWPLEWDTGKCKYANQKVTWDFLFVCNHSACPICHHLWDIHSQKVHDLYFFLIITIDQSQTWICQSKDHMRLPVLAVFALSPFAR